MAIDEDKRYEPPATGDAVTLTRAFHHFLRDTLLWKCSGLSEEQLRWSPVESGTCLLGILKHSLYVERWWIAQHIGGLDVEFPWTEADPNAEWRVEPDDSLASIRALYLAEADRSDLVLASAAWDTVPPDPTGRDRGFSVGWILTHMVEEVARHCGHADLIRELIDGETGE
jgi:uncharacterized damage-inducible protein DinB